MTMKLEELSGTELVNVMNEVMAEVKSRLDEGAVTKYVAREIPSTVDGVQTVKLASVSDLKKGDKVKFIGRPCDFNNDVINGKTYVVGRVNSDDERIILDEKNESYISEMYLHLFEKVVEVETVEHDGKLLRKVDRKSRTGDFVRFNGMSSFDQTTNGHLYEVIDGDRYVCNNGTELFVYAWLDKCPNPEIFEVVGNIGYIRHVSNDKTGKMVFGAKSAALQMCKSPNQQRAELNQRAREFVEGNKRKSTFSNIEKDHYVRGTNGVNCVVEFVVNKDKRTIVAIARGARTNNFIAKGIAKCMPGDVFNEWIGKAIALAKALKIDIPQEFIDAVQPDEVVVGMLVIKTEGNQKESIGNVFKIKPPGNYPIDGNESAIDSIVGKTGTIIDDTNAIYEFESVGE